MKRAIFAIAFIVILALLVAFDGFIPASEMSGSYFKMSTYYQKTFSNFDDGFTDMGLMVSTPLLYRNFSLEIDFASTGDDTWQDMQFNLSPGYQVNSWLTTAVSAGFFRRATDEGNLLFNEAESLDNDEVTAFTVGASVHGSFFDDRLDIGVGLFNINEPSVNMTAAGEENLPMKILADVDWRVSRNVKLGAWYLHENERDYYGAKVGISIPNDFFTTNVWSSSEKLTVAPQFNTLNYWDVMFAYDYHYNSEDLSNEFNNYGVYVSYQLPPSDTPEIIFNDDRFDGEYFETLEEEIPVSFTLTGQERFGEVSVTQNGEEVLGQRGLRDYRGEPFRTHLELAPGVNDVTVRVEGVRGDPGVNNTRIVRLEPEIMLDVLPDTVWQGEWCDIVWLSPLEDASFDIALMDEGGAEWSLTDEPVVNWEAREGLVKSYRFAWQAEQVENAQRYFIRVTDTVSGVIGESMMFTGARYEPVVVDTVDHAAEEAARKAAEEEQRRLEALRRAREIERQRRFIKVERVPGVITNEDVVAIRWMSKVKDGVFHVHLYQGDTMIRELTPAAVTNPVTVDGWDQTYVFNWTAKGLAKGETYAFRVTEQRTEIHDSTNPFQGDVIPPPPPEPEPEPEPEPKGFPLWAGILIGVAVVGGVIWWLVAGRKKG